MPELLAAGYPVRCMAREPGKLADRPWSGDIEIAAADALERRGVQHALENVDVAYYLIHSVGSGWPGRAAEHDAHVRAGLLRVACPVLRRVTRGRSSLRVIATGVPSRKLRLSIT